MPSYVQPGDQGQQRVVWILKTYLITSAVQIVHDKGEVIVQKPSEQVPKVFTFDSVYDWNSEQETVFAETAYPICENVI